MDDESREIESNVDILEKEIKAKQAKARDGPRMVIDKWKRFRTKVDFSDTFRSIVAGSRTGAGKSALVETIVDKHDKHNHGGGKVIDIFASRDNENLCWCRHDKFKDSVLLLTGATTKVSCEWDTMDVNKLTLKDISEYKAVISAPSFYAELREEYHAIDRVLKLLWKRDHYTDPWCVAVREGTSLIYSRLGLGDNQSQAKAAFVYACREFRHCGCAMVIDILRFKGLDTEVRSLADHVFLKAHGIELLPDGLRFIYKHYDMFTDVMKMPQWAFIILTKTGSLGNGRFQLPYWHKTPNENLLDLLDIEISHGEAVNYGNKGKSQVNDFEHADIMRVRAYKGEDGKHPSSRTISKGGLWKINGNTIKIRKRSPRTVWVHMDNHNKDVQAQSFCSVCKRVKATEVMNRIL